MIQLKRKLALFLALCFMLTCVPTVSLATEPTPVTYSWKIDLGGGSVIDSEQLEGFEQENTGDAYYKYVGNDLVNIDSVYIETALKNYDGTVIEREGYTFSGWTTTGPDVDNEFMSTAHWTFNATTVDITLDANNEEYTTKPSTVKATNTGSDQEVFKLSEVPTKLSDTESYTFKGWYTTKDSTGKEVTTSTEFSSNDTIYAQWTEIDEKEEEEEEEEATEFTVTLELNGGTYQNFTPIQQTVKSGEKAVESDEEPTRNGYTFAGWYSNSGLTTSFSFSSAITANTTVYAKWTVDTDGEVDEYIVTFDAGDGKFSTGSSTSVVTTANKKLIYPSSEPTRTGYTFVGWGLVLSNNFTEVAESTTIQGTGDSTDTGTRTFDAYWLKNTGISKITVSEKPDDIVYAEGDKLDPDGLEIVVTYSDGSTETVVYNSSTAPYFYLYPTTSTTLKSSHTSVEVTYMDDYEDSFSITVGDAKMEVELEVEDHEGDPVTGATVKLQQKGSTKYTATDNKDGTYTFAAVEAGTYNLILTYGDHVRSMEVEVSSKDLSLDMELTAQAIATEFTSSSKVTLATVSGLDDLALSLVGDDNEIVSVSLDVSDTVDAYEKDAIMLKKSSSQIIAQIFDITLEKETAYSDSSDVDYKTLTDLDMTISFTFELDSDYEDRDSYYVYRNHGDSVDVLSSSKNSDGEYISVDTDNNLVTVTTCKFSTYALVVSAEEGEEDDDYESLLKPVTLVKKLNHYDSYSEEAGTVTFDNKSPAYGDRVYFTAAANDGYTIVKMSAVDTEGNVLPVEQFMTMENRYYFTQLNHNVTVTVEYIGTTAATAPSTYHGYSDVSTTAYYFYHAYRCRELGLMGGTGDGIFGSDTRTSRGMVAVILYQMAGSPSYLANHTFNDVNEGDWFEPAVLWAKSAGVISGYEDNTFRPDNSVTREEIAAMFYSYAKYAGLNMSSTYKNDYADGGEISNWAVDAVNWCTHHKLFSGYSGNLYGPTATSRRCDVSISLLALYNLENG